MRGFEALARDSFAEALEHYREGLACNHINQAMASDILRLVGAVEQLPVGEAPPAADAQAHHVLLAGYARRLH